MFSFMSHKTQSISSWSSLFKCKTCFFFLLLLFFVFCFFSVSICLIVTYWGLLRRALEFWLCFFQLVAAELLLPIFTLGSRSCCASFHTSRASEKPEQGVAARLTNQWKVEHQHLGSGTIVPSAGKAVLNCASKPCTRLVKSASKTRAWVHLKIDTSPQTNLFASHRRRTRSAVNKHCVALKTPYTELLYVLCTVLAAQELQSQEDFNRKLFSQSVSHQSMKNSTVCLKLVGQRMTRGRYSGFGDPKGRSLMLCSVSRRLSPWPDSKRCVQPWWDYPWRNEFIPAR